MKIDDDCLDTGDFVFSLRVGARIMTIIFLTHRISAALGISNGTRVGRFEGGCQICSSQPQLPHQQHCCSALQRVGSEVLHCDDA
jgi:hypothetical protein